MKLSIDGPYLHAYEIISTAQQVERYVTLSINEYFTRRLMLDRMRSPLTYLPCPQDNH